MTVHKAVLWVAALASLGGSSLAASSNVTAEARSFPFFTFISILRESCSTGVSGFDTGTCYARKECKREGGTAGTTSCAQGLGVCCYFTKTCGETVTANQTHVVNPGYPSAQTSALSQCEVSITLQPNVCQLRLDFVKFSLSQPDTTGECNTDYFSVRNTNNDGSVPMLCGENAGQHMYVDVDPNGSTPKLLFDLGDATFSREWDVRVTQIRCDSLLRAPSGCRQYFYESSGNVQSFNFRTPPYARTDFGVGTTNIQQHLNNQNYQVCIRDQPNMCQIRWEPATDSGTNFYMTGNYAAAPEAIGTASAYVNPFTGASTNPGTGTDPCVDYIIIPGGEFTTIPAAAGGGTAIDAGQADRYCGGVFPPRVTSTVSPFRLDVITDATEGTDTQNVGFNLNYRTLSSGC